MIEDLSFLTDPNFIRPILLTVHQQMTKRIFDEGKDDKNALIGEYTESYIRTRERRGLGSDPKVILQFTGQMRNDFLLISDRNQFGSGFTNQANADKSFWVEETYDKTIFNLTDQEEKLLFDLLNERIDDKVA